MNNFFAATTADVSRLSASGFYNYIVVGSGIGGGVLVQTLIEEGKESRVLLIEQSDLMFGTHCLNSSHPHWNHSIPDGVFQDNSHVFNAVKKRINTTISQSHEYVGSPVHYIGGRNNVWGLYTPKLRKADAKKYFPEDICKYLFDEDVY